jgi:hypothetical protein
VVVISLSVRVTLELMMIVAAPCVRMVRFSIGPPGRTAFRQQGVTVDTQAVAEMVPVAEIGCVETLFAIKRNGNKTHRIFMFSLQCRVGIS